MDRDLFYRGFKKACIQARDMAHLHLETLPEAMEFRVRVEDHLGLHFTYFPEDREGARYLTADEVVDLLWRDGVIPRGVYVRVFGETDEVTLVDVMAYAPFLREHEVLRNKPTGYEPFDAPHPPLPAWAGTKRQSVYQFTMCRTLEELRRALRHADRIQDLTLQGSAANDDVLARVLGSPTVTNLSLTGPIRGNALSALARLPALRVFHLDLHDVEDFSFAKLPRIDGLEAFTVHMLPPAPRGIDILQGSIPNVLNLGLSGVVDVDAPGSALELKRLRHLYLAYPHVPRWVVPGEHLESLTIDARATNDAEVRALLATVNPSLQKLRLLGPVTDEILETVSRFGSLRYLDVTATHISDAARDRFSVALPTCSVLGRTREDDAPDVEGAPQASA